MARTLAAVDDDIDRSQPWQTQRAEALSRGLNRRSPWVRRQALILAAGLLAIVVLVAVVFVITLGEGPPRWIA